MDTNAFISAVGFKPTTMSENGAKTYVTTSSALVDQFGKAGNFRHRDLHEVFSDQAKIWGEDAESALRFPFYLRLVTRKVKVNPKNETEKVQNGQGARDESFKRLLWIAKEHPSDFYDNIWVLPLVGSWKDLWTLMFYDVKENIKCLNQKAIFEVIAQGLLCDTHVDLIKKCRASEGVSSTKTRIESLRLSSKVFSATPMLTWLRSSCRESRARASSLLIGIPSRMTLLRHLLSMWESHTSSTTRPRAVVMRIHSKS